MNQPLTKLSELKKGTRCKVHSFTNEFLKIKLLEMGCLPGETIEVIRLAPFGGPIAIDLSDYTLRLRKDEAATVLVELLEV
ncbi:MAG: ferrous iron transport protein A [Bacteroidia bacterium]|nr:ferrous iron transport protein A [Bacteroidia bacterium]